LAQFFSQTQHIIVGQEKKFGKKYATRNTKTQKIERQLCNLRLHLRPRPLVLLDLVTLLHTLQLRCDWILTNQMLNKSKSNAD
jgi:hypothetical protein